MYICTYVHMYICMYVNQGFWKLVNEKIAMLACIVSAGVLLQPRGICIPVIHLKVLDMGGVSLHVNSQLQHITSPPSPNQTVEHGVSQGRNSSLKGTNPA